MTKVNSSTTLVDTTKAGDLIVEDPAAKTGLESAGTTDSNDSEETVISSQADGANAGDPIVEEPAAKTGLESADATKSNAIDENIGDSTTTEEVIQPENTSKHSARAKELFEANPAVNELHFTSDGIGFLNGYDASFYAMHNLENKEIETVNR